MASFPTIGQLPDWPRMAVVGRAAAEKKAGAVEKDAAVLYHSQGHSRRGRSPGSPGSPRYLPIEETQYLPFPHKSKPLLGWKYRSPSIPQPISQQLKKLRLSLSPSRMRQTRVHWQKFQGKLNREYRNVEMQLGKLKSGATRQKDHFVEELARPAEAGISQSEFFLEEQKTSLERFMKLRSLGCEYRPFSVAFSGGGIRAAAFHCGVLWRLADCGRLQDVEHLSLVSGGAYVGTALLTFLLAQSQASAPGTAAELHKWYLQVVWSLISRMQSNAGFMIRFSRKLFTRKGAHPPVQGLLLFIVTLFSSLVLIPLIGFALMAFPFALLIDADAGAEMRQAWCCSATHLNWWVGHRGTTLVLALILAAVFEALASKSAQWKTPHVYVCLLEMRNLLLYVSLVFAFMLLTVAGTLAVQWVESSGDFDALSTEAPRCVDVLHEGQLWHAEVTPRLKATKNKDMFLEFDLWYVWMVINLLIAGLGILGSCLKWRFLVVRVKNLAALLWPMWSAFMTLIVVRWRVFGVLEDDTHAAMWTLFSRSVLVTALLVLIPYGQLRRLVHLYSSSCLRQAFYHDGQEVKLNEAGKSPFCPNVIMSGTLIDYFRVSDADDSPHFSEFFFTPDWMGGERTGFIRTPPDLELSRTMAISAAATDAFLFTRMNLVWVRATVLAFFNVFMGDWIDFRSSVPKGRLAQGQIQAFGVNILFVGFYVAMHFADQLNQQGACRLYHPIFWTSWGLLAIVMALSFFASFKCLRWLLSSVIIRHLHMVLMHYHKSDMPPVRLFLNDGGLVECLGLISLLRRRCKTILVTDATADFSMQLSCLRESMQLAEKERLCSFYDPDRPWRGVEPLLQDFVESKSSYVKLGVLYDCWGTDNRDSRNIGQILFIRMRLLDPNQRVRAQRISQDEVLQGAEPHIQSPGKQSIADMYAQDVGGCCCDCCHTYCNCGCVGRFPEISSGNQFLTQTQFALLCRLGYEMSADAVSEISGRQAKMEGDPGAGLADVQHHWGSLPLSSSLRPFAAEQLTPTSSFS